MIFTQDKFDFVTSEENNFKTNRVAITEGWDWNMYDHVNLSTLYKNSTYKTGKNDDKPFKNITRPLLNLQYRTEGFDVKDIQLYLNDPEEYYKSLLVKKYHDKWAREKNIDTFIDELVESYVDYGGALVKDVNQECPELVPLQRLAFCDQTDILGGPICEKHFYSIDQLREMKNHGWDAQAIEDVIILSDAYKKSQTVGNRENKTPSKYIEVYELHGTLPDWWLGGEPNDEMIGQVQILTYYKDQQDNKHGIELFSGKEKDSIYKFIARDKIYGRALGLGGAEELFEAQVWTNSDIQRIKGLLDAAAKVIYLSTDQNIASRNKISDMENGEFVIAAPNTTTGQLNTTPVNMPLFERSIVDWENHAQQMASAGEAQLGESPSSGTPFRLQAAVIQQGQALHQYRQGKLAVFVAEIYRDWVIPYIVKEITKGTVFLSELSLEELQSVVDSVVTSEANDLIKEKVLNGEEIKPEEIDAYKQQVKTGFMKGNKKFMEILKGEMKDASVDIEVVIKGKQKDLSGFVDSISNVFKTIFANPAVLQDPTMNKLLNQILTASGLEPIEVSATPQQPVQQQLPVKQLQPQ